MAGLQFKWPGWPLALIKDNSGLWWHKCNYEIPNLSVAKFPSNPFKLVKVHREVPLLRLLLVSRLRFLLQLHG